VATQYFGVSCSSYTASAQAADAERQLAGVPVAAVHGYFAHRPAVVAEDLARRLRVPFGFSAHARDARKVPRHELHARARRAACVIACNADVAREFDGSEAHVAMVPHGVDLQRFRARHQAPSPCFSMLAVGRLVEKKGFHVLLDAAARLDFPFRLRVVGDGPERERLLRMVEMHGLLERVTLEGSLTHAELPEAYAGADAVVVPSIQDSSGDRDGLPNVVLEAMASGRTVVASDVGGIASAIEDSENGLLVPPGDPVALGDAIRRLSQSKSLREQLGRNGRRRVEQDYEVGRCSDRFHQLLTSVYL